MVIEQGDIYWVDLGTPIGSSPGFTRPYVVVQNNFFNQSGLNTIILCALTSNVGRARYNGNVLLYEGEAGLPKDSVVMVSQLYSADKSQLREYIGTLSRKRVREILHGLKLMTEPREYQEKPSVD